MKALLGDIKQLEKIDRPREKLKRLGINSLTDQELIALIIGSGNKNHKLNEISADILSLLESEGLPKNLEQLQRIGGLGFSKSSALLAAIELTRRRLNPSHFKLKTPSDVVPLLANYAYKPQEHFLCVSLNGAYEILAIRVISIGLVNKTFAHPREIFSDPVAERSAAVIIAHNHPSGNFQPSKEDFETTARVKEAGEILGIPLLDHIIISREGFYSFLNSNTL